MFEALKKITLHRILEAQKIIGVSRKLAINYCDLMALELVNQLAGWRQ